MARSEWEETIADLLTKTGWTFHHQRAAWTSKGYRSTISGMKGMIDFICFRDLRHPIVSNGIVVVIRKVVIEAKTGSDKPTPEQEIWLEFFRKAGFEVYVLYPKDRLQLEKILI